MTTPLINNNLIPEQPIQPNPDMVPQEPYIEEPSEVAVQTEPLGQPFRPEMQQVDMREQMADIKTEAGTMDELSSFDPEKNLPTGNTAEVKEFTAVQGQNTDDGVAARTAMYGYIPPSQVVVNSRVISQKGSVSDAKTWIASILNRLADMLS